MTAPSRGLLAAGAAAAVAALVFGAALLRALAPTPVALGDAPPMMGDVATAGAVHDVLDNDALEQALQSDPFSPARQRPHQRYRLPGDVDPPLPPPPPAPPPVPEFRVSGTAVTPDGGFAVLGIGDGAARIVGVGEYLAGYQVARVTTDAVIMSNDDGEVRVPVPAPSARIATAPEPPMPRQGQQGGGRNQQQRQQMTPEQARMMQQILERARSDGATPQMLQAIQQIIQQRGIENFQNSEIVIQDGSMRIMPRRPPGGGQ
ncbi:MAG TPA: hypothetical protein VK929_03110 [Longimicrobiales bacterium]|nr:hypothetical protein [Longimicrobiales bacterium]